MKLRLIIIGRDRQDPLVGAANDYLERLGRHYGVELVELKEEPAKAKRPVGEVKAKEAERIRKALGPGAYFVALDERGRQLDSIEWSKQLGRWLDDGRSEITFVIGGPNGLDAHLVRDANDRFALSKATLPHRLARVVLCEQLYRASTILRGEPYHK